MTISGDSLQPFIARGWSIRSTSGWKLYAVSPDSTPGYPMAIAVDSLAGTATRVIAAAALVAEGHDLIGLLREARDATRVSIPPRGWHDAQADIIARLDAVLDAVDGET